MGILRPSLAVALLAAGLVLPASAGAAPPGPCGGTAHITDATGDGHHSGTDVVSAWFAETTDGLQTVIKPANGNWGSEHDDEETATWAMLFTVGGQTRYVRLSARTAAPPAYDVGTWTLAGGFASTGSTSGLTEPGFGGTVRIAVPAALSGPAGTVLARPFVLTSDGLDGPGQPHWVDRGPGGTSPAEASYGADFRVGTCVGAGAGGGPGGAGATGTGDAGQAGGPAATGSAGSAGPAGDGTGSGTAGTGTAGGTGGLTAVLLSVAPRRTGAGTQTVSGRITPARGGVPVRITASPAGGGRSTTRTATTAADGRFAARVRVAETTRLRAVAEGLGSQTRTVTVTAKVRITVRRLRSGAAVVTGTVSPAVPGRVLWLRTTAITPSARATVTRGRFTLRLRRPVRGRYQAIFTPRSERAERSTSNTGVIR